MKKSRPRLQIIRGLPGSGKTTLAIERYSHLMRIETDMFFYRQGAYRFTLENNKKAVEWFNNAIIRLCSTGMDFVATGVFAAHTERLAFAIQCASDWGYDVYVKTLTSQYKGIHAVPQEHFDAMKASFLSERKLKGMFTAKGYPHLHFGLMDKGMELVHLKKPHGRK